MSSSLLRFTRNLARKPLIRQTAVRLNSTSSLNEEEKRNIRRRRIILNSRNRGRVETELFIGGFLSKRIWNMTDEEMNELEKILDEADIDLYNWVSGIQPMPEDLHKLGVMKELLAYVQSKKPSGKKKPEDYRNFVDDYDTAAIAPKE